MKRRAFTLVELMVSIGIVLVLMIGVSTVFRTISQTVSAGSAVSDNTRVARAAQAVFAQDFGSIVTGNTAPFIIIESESIAAFRNRPDELSDRDYNAAAPTAATIRTIDVNGNNSEGDAGVGGETISPATPNFRNHRSDNLAFFIRALTKRQAGNPGQNLISPMTAEAAFVKYGHLRMWDGVGSLSSATSFKNPGEGTFGNNANNFYGSQFTLGRMAIVLTEGVDTDGNGFADQIFDNSTPPQEQRFWRRKTAAGPTAHRVLAPLSEGSQIDNAAQPVIQETATDIAGVSLNQFRALMLAYLADPGSPADWPDRFTYRFCANSFAPPRPLTTQSLAQTLPVFVPGCAQFIVEYAGDYIAQNNDPTSPTFGQTTGWYNSTTATERTDGKIDYILIGTGATRRKEVRWYGLPRDTRNAGTIPGNVTSPDNAQLFNVVPLRDVIRTAPGETANMTGAPFEKVVPAAKTDYLATTGLQPAERYQCAWGPNDPKPKLIRITLVLDDPAGRNPNPDGQTFEYVFDLP